MQHDPTKTKFEYLKHNNLRPQYESGLKALIVQYIINEIKNDVIVSV